MPGKWITEQQVKIYMNSRQLGNNQQLSSAKAGISERTGRDIEHAQPRQERGKPAVGKQRESSSHLRAEGERARERE